MDAISLLSSSQFLTQLVIKGTLLMAIAFGVTFLLRRRSAALRHAVWSLAFLGLLLLPAGAAFLPAWHVPLPQLAAVDSPRPERSTPTPAFRVEASNGVVVEQSMPAVRTDEPGRNWSWTGAALLLWLTGALVLFVRMVIVLNKLSLVRRSAIPVTDREWTVLAEVLPEMLGVRRSVVLLQHEQVHVPMTYGVRHPVILLPIQADAWPEDQKRVILMHELLHVRRFDYVVHMLALAARALHWFNPLAWLAARRLVVERERACDDGVLAMGVASTSYADHLLDMARFVLSGNEASTAALAMARPSELRSRVIAILNPAQSRRSLTPLRFAGLTLSALAVVLLVAAAQPARPAVRASTGGIQNQPEAGIVIIDEVGNADEVRNADEVEDVTTEPETPASLGEIETPAGGETPSRADTTEVDAQRRAVFAISQLPEERSIPLLRDIAESHPNAQIRAEAIFWLGQAGGESVADLLVRFARSDASIDVQKRAVFALSQTEGSAGRDRLIDLARTHPNPELQGEAVFWLGQSEGSGVADILLDFARNGKHPEIQKKAVFALAELVEGGVEHLIDLARTHANPVVRGEAIFWLGESGDPRAADLLMDIVNGK